MKTRDHPQLPLQKKEVRSNILWNLVVGIATVSPQKQGLYTCLWLVGVSASRGLFGQKV